MHAAWTRDGVLVLEGFAGADACADLRARGAEIVADFDPGPARPTFSTTDPAHLDDAYFETSGDKIRCFFEADAFDATGALGQPKAQSINKIGHALHDMDPVFARFSRQPTLARLARALGVREPLLLQSMYIFKQPRIGGEVTCHQDATFLYTEPLSCVGFWFALEAATVDNGCLYVHAGAHAAPLATRHRRGADGRLATETLAPADWQGRSPQPLEVPAGTLVVLDGKLPHLSGANRSPHSREAYSLHVIDGACHYPADNWLVRAADMPLRGS